MLLDCVAAAGLLLAQYTALDQKDKCGAGCCKQQHFTGAQYFH